jgi:hypothetical protein
VAGPAAWRAREREEVGAASTGSV